MEFGHGPVDLASGVWGRESAHSGAHNGSWGETNSQVMQTMGRLECQGLT